MLKRHWKAALLVLLALLAAAAALWAVRTRGSTAADAAQTEADESDAAAYVMIYENDITQFKRLTVTVRGEEPYAVVSDMVYEDGELLGVHNALGQPVVLEGREDFHFQTYAWQMMALAAQHLPATQELTGGAPADYGLDDPAFTLTVENGDGTAFTVAVGNLTPTGDSCYVAYEGRTYLVPSDLYATFAGGLNATHFLPTSLGFAAEDVTRLQIDTPDGEPLVILEKDDAADALIPYEMVSPLCHEVNTERLTAALEGVCEALPTAYAGTVGINGEAAAYGLDVPALRLTLVIGEQYLAQIAVGGDAADGMAYVTVDQSGDVYLVSREKLDFVSRMTAENLLEQYVSLVPVKTLAQAEVEAGGRRLTLSAVWGEDAAVAETYAVNGEPVAREEFTALYQQLIALMLDKVSPGLTVSGEPLMTAAFTRLDGTITTVRYFPYDEFYDAVEIDGSADYLIRSYKVEQLIAALFAR